MNALLEDLDGASFHALAFPSSNFYLEEPGMDSELLNGLKYVRPGNGFIPHPNIHFFTKGDVNGDNENPIYTIMKAACPPLTEEIGDPSFLMYSPMTARDITWNYNKFLVDKNGFVRYRFESATSPTVLKPWVEELLKE